MTASRQRRRVRIALAVLSAGAGVAHASVIADHVSVVWWYGAAFALVAAAQIAWAAMLLVRPAGRRLLAAGAIGNAAVLAAWVAARTTGLPFVPAESSSAVGLLDGTTAAFQGLIVLGVLASTSVWVRVRPRMQHAVGVAAGVALLLTAPLTVAALAAGPGPHGPGDADHSHAEDGHGPAEDVARDGVEEAGHSHADDAEPHDH